MQASYPDPCKQPPALIIGVYPFVLIRLIFDYLWKNTSQTLRITIPDNKSPVRDVIIGRGFSMSVYQIGQQL
jgi:hypothetical protein